MFRTQLFTLALIAFAAVQSAPTAALDGATLLLNGQTAQQLNTEFSTLSTADPCTSCQNACINGALAQCVGSQWTTQQCPSSLQCFAVPSVRESGAIVECTSERTALSLIAACGAQGGLTSNTTNDSSVPFPNSEDGNGQSSNSSAASTVTVFVTLGSSPTTLPPETRTLAPAEASSLYPDFTSGTTFTVASVIIPSPALIPSYDDGASPSAPAPTTILLTSQTSAQVSSATATCTPAVQSDVNNAAASTAAPTTIFLTARPQASL